jgi:hypothetical protein
MDAADFTEIASYQLNGRDLAWNPDGKQLAVAASFGIFIRDIP